MKNKLIAMLVALILIGIVAAVGVGVPTYEKYSYGTDYADLASFYNSVESQAGTSYAIILGTNKIEEQAVMRNGACYFDIETVHEYLNETFYVDLESGNDRLLYTDAEQTWYAEPNATYYVGADGEHSEGYEIWFKADDKVYVAADYVQLFTVFDYSVYDRHVHLVNESYPVNYLKVTKDTQIRKAGGIKSDILRDVESGERVVLLEAMENWSKVMTDDAFIGYIENKKLEDGTESKVNISQVTEADIINPEYTTIRLNEKVCLGFHSIGGVGGNDTIYSAMDEATGINVIAPTWFSLCNNEGDYRSYASSAYVAAAHKNNIQVWGVVDNFNFSAETGIDINELAVLSDTNKREKLIKALVAEATTLGIDGINVDFETLSSDCGPYYVQFLRELGVACRKAELIFSVDDYVPFNFNDFYRIDIQGQIADYVVIMGYDEHYHGSGNAGSVASIEYVMFGMDKTMETVDSSKIVNALPFYMLQWKSQGGSVTDQYITIKNLDEYLDKIGIKPSWDEKTAQNYASWSSGGASYEIWFEDKDSITAKLNAMKARNIGGVAVWSIGFGTPEVWNLVSLYASMP